ncbi:MAG: VOC family protein [Rhodospirillales bacterium]|nr:VOC family protein [Rhodospirillales bacterium]
MPRGVIDIAGLNTPDVVALKATKTPTGMPFNITKLGHAVLKVRDLELSVKFYTEVMGFRVSDAYPDTMIPGRMVFMRFNTDHHGVALVGGAAEESDNTELHHMAFEVATLDEVLRARDHLKKHNVKMEFDGRRRAGAQIAVEFRDPDNHMLEIYWGIDQIGSDGRARPPEDWVEEMSLEDAIDSAPPGQDTSLQDPSLRK